MDPLLDSTGSIGSCWSLLAGGLHLTPFYFLIRSSPALQVASQMQHGHLGLSTQAPLCLCVLVAQSCPTLRDPVDCSPSGCCVHGLLQARILEWVAMSFSRGFSQLRDQTWVFCMVGRFFTM